MSLVRQERMSSENRKLELRWCRGVLFKLVGLKITATTTGFLHSSAGKESACNAGDLGSTPGLGRSPGKGNS